MRLLILGGTTEASALAEALSRRDDLAPILSFAGRTEKPAQPPVPYRIGGFGGVAGLTAYLRHQRIDAIVDATHPFAGRISVNAAQAAETLALPFAVFTRPPWSMQPGGEWHRVADLESAAAVLGTEPKTVFLTSGRLGVAAFKAAPQHRYILRSIDPPAPPDCPPLCVVILARGPFGIADEEALMRRHRIECLVSKNSGGRLGAAKLEAARTLRIPVVMVDRPPTTGAADRFTELDAVLSWIEHHRGPPPRDGSVAR